jgi:hypothetical protein
MDEMIDAWDLVTALVEADIEMREARQAAAKASTRLTVAQNRLDDLVQQANDVLDGVIPDGECIVHDIGRAKYAVTCGRLGVHITPVATVALSSIKLQPEPLAPELASWAKHDPDGVLSEQIDSLVVNAAL